MARPKKELTGQGVYDRGSAWQVRVKRQDAAGNIHRINRTFPYNKLSASVAADSRAAVFKHAAAFAASERAALHVEKRPASDLLGTQTLSKWIDRYIAEICPKKKAGKGDERLLRSIQERFPKLCNRPVADLLPRDFGMTSLGMGHTLDETYLLAPATVRRNQAVVSQVFTAAIEEWHYSLKENPLLKATKPAISNSRERVVSPEEWRSILDCLAPMRPATRAAILFMRWTACRRGEAVKLRWEDVSLEGTPQAIFRDTKNPIAGQVSSRTIPLTKDAVSALNTLTAEHHAVWLARHGKTLKNHPVPANPGHGPVFSVDEGNSPIAADSLTQAWERACHAAGVTGATLHDLRHTRLTELANLLPLQKVMRISGHKTAQMLMRYYNPKVEDLAADLEAAIRTKNRQKSSGRTKQQN
ncbi:MULTISPECIES: site-specific integrase [unclassified Stenotrophomonas]|uniref:tyrosine-type recombinase/integrase n=1 Tax=unclassified Stenotrophomonas TaxID=196198 RepID=UPI0005AEDEDF|nr:MULTISPECIES: site-specific integrase [unclassified Stenotrophomonas]KIP86777.1 hypothetical protein SN15_06105 [Stenotrophomonas maltophilia]MBD8636661.1 site-specific integrase [Stenotrophomonas sp. CFBP 13725]MBD8696846.1 site-specific integrase [Stenotrophomonas sp. CFBP 13718]